MKQLPKVSKVALEELEYKNKTKPVIAGIIATMLSGASIQANASTDASVITPAIQTTVTQNTNTSGNTSAVILNKPALEGEAFAAHYSHSSHSSHSSHYSCTPGSTC
ncbi:hypothetical protein M979_1078 [Buttiauxella noackiae ATCC 51607]|jgi:hypothetical protein|uniref:Uncharacterized protein n=1 Tax=Buttiauxella noackiae ATCC 51607 TaxID=1354255 RepID=A0A1B7HVU2_9ENTR|nr:hypothetical protein [Buttiauxella noackiae]OAT19766.1 hypothetical protein M979_1078 [Buttiauxella noackiae ATCC 51607]